MSTGIPQKGESNAKPYTLAYSGKMPEKDVITGDFSQYVKIKDIGENAFNHFYFGDNLDVLKYLLNNGYKEKIKLVYIDPPFASASLFVNMDQDVAYTDYLLGANYIEFLRERLIVIKELLLKSGSLYVHLDERMIFPIKIILDEIFGEKNCRAFITRKKCSTKNTTKNSFGKIADYILFYSKTNSYTWNRPYEKWTDSRIKEQYPFIEVETGKRFKKVPIHAPGVRNGESGKEWRGMLPPQGKHWLYTPQKLDELDAKGEIVWSENGNPRRKVYFDNSEGIPFQNIWLEYRDFVNQTLLTSGYPTEKNLEMLKMIVETSTNEGDLVMDCFAGSGTTLEAATLLKRKWIGVDNSLASLKAVLSRFTRGLLRYGDFVKKKTRKDSAQQPINNFADGFNNFDIYSTKDTAKSILDLD